MTKAKVELKEEGEPIVEVYRVLSPIVLSTNRQLYMPGAIVDLSHLPDKSIQHFLRIGQFELADGEPENVPQPISEGRKPRPCCK